MMLRCLVMLLSCLVLPVYAATTPSGTWVTIDDATNKPRSVVQISFHNGKLFGRIKHVFKQENDTGRCHRCPGNFRNHPVVGLQFLWNLHQVDEATWDGGKILDPKSGKIYNCKITMSSDAMRLTVRGYVGIPLLGRSQTWHRES